MSLGVIVYFKITTFVKLAHYNIKFATLIRLATHYNFSLVLDQHSRMPSWVHVQEPKYHSLFQNCNCDQIIAL